MFYHINDPILHKKAKMVIINIIKRKIATNFCHQYTVLNGNNTYLIILFNQIDRLENKVTINQNRQVKDVSTVDLVIVVSL